MAELRLDVEEGVAFIALDDPARRNALTPGLVDRLVAALDQVEGSDVGATVITGAPPAFCAGADLSELGTSREEGLRHIYEGFLRVARCPLPTIAAVNGPAVGAGMNLALACDVRIAARSARFDARFLRLGIHPGGGHTWMLRRVAGAQTAAAMVLFGEVLDGEQASEAGLVWRCVDDDRLLDSAAVLARQAASQPRELTRRTKDTLDDMASVESHDTAVERELETQLWSMDQPEFAERLAEMQRRVTGDNRGAPH
jgi:enoyl-CoA hydratase